MLLICAVSILCCCITCSLSLHSTASASTVKTVLHCALQAAAKPLTTASATSQGLQLRQAAALTPDIPQLNTSSSPATDLSTHIPANRPVHAAANTLAHIPGNSCASLPTAVVDRLLNGGNPSPESHSRRRSRGHPTPPPRTKNTRSRQSKRELPSWRQPLLPSSTPAAAHGAAEALDAHTHRYHPLQDVDSQPCSGVIDRLGSSLSAVWQWLCKTGGSLKQLGRKLCQKLMRALGLGQEEAQRLLAQQQAQEREALPVTSHRSMQHLPTGHIQKQPQGPSRLHQWRM